MRKNESSKNQYIIIIFLFFLIFLKIKKKLLPQIKLNTTILKEERVLGERTEYVDEWEKYKVNKIIFSTYDKGYFFL